MAQFKLAKLYDQNNNALTLRSTDVYHVATKQLLSTYITETATTIAAIQAALSGHSKTTVVNTIALRDAQTNVNNGDTCWVKDATSDATVNSGAACYIAEVAGDPATVTWTKITEAESLDVILQWSSIQGKPSSAVADIDQAVTDSHTHANSTVLAGISEDESGDLVYNNKTLNGETGLAFVASTEATASYTGKLKIVVEDFDDSAE